MNFTRKIMLTMMSVLMAAAIFAFAPCDAQAGQDYEIGSYITTNHDTKLFTLPDANEGVVSEIPEGVCCVVVENDEIYTKVSSDYGTGYLYQEYIGYDKAVVDAYKAVLLARSEEIRELAAIIQCEAGCEIYEGQLAVGNVVMNRLAGGKYGSTIHDVIYAPGQFGPAGTGKVAALMASNGIKESCRKAAMEAFQGNDITGGALHFGRGIGGLSIGNHDFH